MCLSLTRSVVMAGVLGVSACQLGPDFVTPPPPAADVRYLPADQAPSPQVALGQKISGQWWTLLNSPQLNGLIDQVLQHNRDLAAATATLTQAQQQAEAVAGVLYPSLSAHGGAVREKVNFTSYGMTFPPAIQNLYSVGGTVSYALDVLGHDRRMAEAAAANAQAEQYRLNGAYLALTGQVVRHSLAYAGIRDQIAQVTAMVQADQKRLALLQQARQAGTLSDRDLAEIEAQMAGDAALLPPLQAQSAALRHALAVLVGQRPDQFTPPDLTLDGLTPPQAIPVSLPSELVRQRPDILAAEAELHAATALVGVAQASRYPRIMLSADITQWATLPGHLWSNLASGANGGAGLTAPLFQGGQLQAQQRAAEAAYQASEAHYEQVVLQAFAQVATVMQGVAQDTDQQQQTQRAAQAATKLFTMVELGRQTGASSDVDLLTADHRARLTRLAAIQSRVQTLQDSAQLLLAMGGGWWN